MIKIIKRIINYTQHKTIVVEEEEEEITDEIEKSLWALKQKYDFDTEEISVVVKDYKNRSFNNKNK